MQKYLDEVEKALRGVSLPSKPSPWLAENYIGGGQSKLTYLNIKIPSVRSAFKNGFSFSNLSAREQWKIWDYIWSHSQIFEVMLMSSYWVSSRSVDELIQNRKIILSWLSRVDNWAHSDELSSHYAKVLEHDTKLFLPTFKKWNQSKNPWFKRQSMVGLLFYSRFRKKVLPFKTLISFVERHIDDGHYYVQKGVGWTIRECWNVYPKETFLYLKKNAHRVPPAGWTAATEKLRPQEKKILTQLRRTKAR